MSPGTTRTDVLRLLGLAQRAGAVIRGTGAVRDAVRSGEARLVLTATDASEQQLEKVRALLRHREVPERTLASREELGAAIGRSPLTAVALSQESFATRIREMLDS